MVLCEQYASTDPSGQRPHVLLWLPSFVGAVEIRLDLCLAHRVEVIVRHCFFGGKSFLKYDQ